METLLTILMGITAFSTLIIISTMTSSIKKRKIAIVCTIVLGSLTVLTSVITGESFFMVAIWFLFTLIWVKAYIDLKK